MLPCARNKAVDVSLLVATRNRAVILQQTLESLACQMLDGTTWEVIVVDNGSTDETQDVLLRMRSVLPLVQLDEPAPGKNRALNRALAVARGRLLLFTDDDVVADPNWVHEMRAAAARWPEQTILAGAIRPLFENGVPSWIRATRFRYRRLAFCGFQPQEQEGYIEQRAFGANWAVHRRCVEGMVFCETIGPQGTRNYPVGSETEFLARLEERGARTVFVPAARVQHVITAEQSQVRALLGRAFRAGRGDVALGEPLRGWLVAGAPAYVWKWLAGAALRYAVSVFCNRLVRLERGMDLWRAWGRIYQLRRMREQQHQSPAASRGSHNGA